MESQVLGSQVLEVFQVLVASQVLVVSQVLVASQVLGAQALWVDQGLCHQLLLLKLLPKLPNMEPEVELAFQPMELVLGAFLAMVLEPEPDSEQVQAKQLLLLLPKLLNMVLEEPEAWEAWCQV